MAVLEICFDQFSEVADRQDDISNPLSNELPDDDFQDRPVSDGDKRLRKYCRVGCEASPLPSRQDYRFHIVPQLNNTD